jgi:transcriptional regulator with XRE-family HTH domain
MKTFGEVVAEARTVRGLTQKALAAKIKKKDATTIGFAYINDIEHNRRKPPVPHFIAQLAQVLGVPQDVFRFYGRRLDEEVFSRYDDPSHERIVAAYVAFKRKLGGELR